MTNEIDNFYVRARKLIVPGSYQRSSYLSKVLEDIGAGFDKIDAYTGVPSGASTTVAATGNRNVFITGNSLTHQVNMPSAPTAADPPVRVYNFGTGNVITISGNGNKIMSGNTAGEITLRCPGDYIELRYINSTIGWGIIAINSNRVVTISATPTDVQLNRFQSTFIDARGTDYVVNLLPPTDSQVGDRCIVSIKADYHVADSITFNSVEQISYVAANGFINMVAWKTGGGWVVGTYN